MKETIPFDTNYIYKMRGGDVVVILDKQCITEKVFYTEEDIRKSNIGGICRVSSIDSYGLYSNWNYRYNEYDIVAYKRFNSQSEALGKLLNGYTSDWDWERKEILELSIDEAVQKLKELYHNYVIKIIDDGDDNERG